MGPWILDRWRTMVGMCSRRIKSFAIGFCTRSAITATRVCPKPVYAELARPPKGHWDKIVDADTVGSMATRYMMEGEG